MSKAPVIILEGTWWSNHEVPLVLPYFHALAISHRQVELSHRTIRNEDDIAYHVSRIPKNAGAMLYFACHGQALNLIPSDGRSPVSRTDLLRALAKKKEGAISFVHFGCCEMVGEKRRRQTHQEILDASGAKWASGYTKSVDWLQCMLLDLALVSEVFVPDYFKRDGRAVKLKNKANSFVKTYRQLAKELGFSALSKVSGGIDLFPRRQHQ